MSIEYKEIFTVLSHSTAETESAGALLAAMLAKGDFVALRGGLGAGKTAFVRGMASVIVPGAAVKSPTYTIVNVYRSGEKSFYHFDTYRIKDEDDLESTGFYDYTDGIIALEWPEKAPGALPDRYYSVEITGSGEEIRKIKVRLASVSRRNRI